MILSFFDTLKEIIQELFTKFSLSNFFTLLIGISIGFLICISIYLVFVFIAFKKNDKLIVKETIQLDEGKIEKLIKSAKNEYIEESSFLSTAQKLTDVKKISWELINSIAKEYYPESNYPIYELSIEEMMTLIHYITNRIDTIFTGPVLKIFKKVKVAQILKLLDLKKKIDENKVIKTANKARIPKILSSITAVLNVFNPVYWVKKLMVNTTLVSATNKIALTIIDVVGEETNKVYSKSVFNVEKSVSSEVDKTITEIENMIKEDKE